MVEMREKRENERMKGRLENGGMREMRREGGYL